MDIVGVAGALSRVRFETQYLGAVLAQQADLTEELGAQAIQLIQASAIDPQVGNQLDLRI